MAFSIAADGCGDRLPVYGLFPAHVDNAAGIAALVQEAAADAGLSFARFMRLIQAEAPPVVPRGGPAPLAPHRPRLDWKTEHGASLTELCVLTDRHLAAKPTITKVEASGAALQEARKSAKMPRLTADALKVWTAALKQAFRRLPREKVRGKPHPPKYF